MQQTSTALKQSSFIEFDKRLKILDERLLKGKKRLDSLIDESIEKIENQAMHETSRFGSDVYGSVESKAEGIKGVVNPYSFQTTSRSGAKFLHKKSPTASHMDIGGALPVIVSNIQIAQRIINISNSLAISCLQHNLNDLANYYIGKAYKTDLTLFELETNQQEKIYAWKGRLLLNNILAYHQFTAQKDYIKAMKFISESQQIASKFLQQIQLKSQNQSQQNEIWRDLDYMVQTNFLAFLILWKAKRYEQSQKYISLSKRYIYQFLNQESEQQNNGNKDLSNLQIFNHPATADNDNRDSIHKDSLDEMGENQNEVHNEILEYLLQSDAEDVENQNMNQSQFGPKLNVPAQKVQRMSQLSKLNLLGLINLSDIVCQLKMTQDTDQAINRVREAIIELKQLNSKNSDHPQNQVGIASQNIMEEYLQNLLRVKERGLDLPLDSDGNIAILEEDMYEQISHLDLNHLCKDDKALLNIRKGNKIIGAQDFMLVFFITCFLPFVRPTIPQLKETEIIKARKSQKKVLAMLLTDNHATDPASGFPLDIEFMNECKTTVKQLFEQKDNLKFNGKSMYLKMHEERQNKQQVKSSAFTQSLFVAEKNKKGNIFWEQLPSNTVKFENSKSFNKKFRYKSSMQISSQRKTSNDRNISMIKQRELYSQSHFFRNLNEVNNQELFTNQPGPSGRFRFLKNNKYIQGVMSPSQTGMDSKLYEVDKYNQKMSMSSKKFGHNRYQTQSNLTDFNDYARVDYPKQNPFSQTQSRMLPELRKSHDITLITAGMRNKRSSYTNFIPKRETKQELLEQSLENFSSRIKHTNQDRSDYLKNKKHFQKLLDGQQ